MRRKILLSLLAFSFGCVGAPGSLWVSPSVLELSLIDETGTLVLGNQGEESLTVVALNFEDGATALSVSNTELPFTLEPGAEREVEVARMGPEDCGVRRRIVIDWIANGRHTTIVGFAPWASRGEVAIRALPLDFGSVPVGTGVGMEVKLVNTGDCTIPVGDLDLIGSHDFSYGETAGTGEFGEPGLIFSLEPDEVLTIPIEYTPTDSGADEGSLVFGTGSADQTQRLIRLTGEGV